MRPDSGLLGLQLSEVRVKIVLAEFMLDGQVKAVGPLESYLNNDTYKYVSLINCVATPLRQTNPLKTIGYDEGYLKAEDILLVYPTDPEVQTKIKLMPKAQRGIFYAGEFVIQANLSMGMEMKLSSALDALAQQFARRFLAITDALIFPMFPTRTALPKIMPIALLNREKVSHYHAAEKQSATEGSLPLLKKLREKQG
jgi:hypothetical protein